MKAPTGETEKIVLRSKEENERVREEERERERTRKKKKDSFTVTPLATSASFPTLAKSESSLSLSSMYFLLAAFFSSIRWKRTSAVELLRCSELERRLRLKFSVSLRITSHA